MKLNCEKGSTFNTFQFVYDGMNHENMVDRIYNRYRNVHRCLPACLQYQVNRDTRTLYNTLNYSLYTGTIIDITISITNTRISIYIALGT
jgi:hypothetical protein